MVGVPYMGDSEVSGRPALISSCSMSTSMGTMELGLGQATVARVMHVFATTKAQQVIALGQEATIVETESAWSV